MRSQAHQRVKSLSASSTRSRKEVRLVSGIALSPNAALRANMSSSAPLMPVSMRVRNLSARSDGMPTSGWLSSQRASSSDADIPKPSGRMLPVTDSTSADLRAGRSCFRAAAAELRRLVYRELRLCPRDARADWVARSMFFPTATPIRTDLEGSRCEGQSV